ncbi:MAG: peptidoglycan-binding protein, partial [Patescibacteria group bacterium]|nr:peptidoglycan-binding protein [Patescibacteria group bacterium]
MRFIGVALVSLLALISVGTAFADIPVQTCIVLSHNLSAGASDSSAGGDVSALQAYLNQQNYLSTSAVGIFGPKTYAAVKSFQVAHGLPATGYVGPLTRAVLNCGTQTLLPPTSVSGSGTSVTSSSSSNSNNPAPQLQALAPSSGTVGTSVTLYGSGFASDNKILFDNRFLVHASSADASTLTFTVPNAFRPDCLAGQPCPQWLQPLGAKTYNVSVETNGGTSNSLPFMVTEATSGNQPSISLTYPRGGQVLDDSPSTSGSAKTLATITWTTTNFGSLSVGISLKDTNGDYLKAIATNIPNTGSYTWMQDSSIPNGKYKIDIYSADKGPSADDLGDYIQIVNSPLGTPSNPSIVIEDPRNGNGYDIGTWAYIPTYWNESGFTPKNIQIYLDGSFVGVAPILVATLGASTATHYDVPIPANTPSGHLYAITVCDNGTVNPSTGKPICDISDDFTITNNGSATTGSGLTVSGGAQPASGYASIGLLAPFINFTLSSGGASATVNSIQVQRTGASTDADLTDVYVVDTANGLTIGRGTLNTNHIATISFQTPVTISAGSSHSFTVYGDIAPSASVGHVLSLALTSVSANVSEVHGSLPISGATFSLQQPTNPPNQGAVPSCFLSALPVTLPVGGIYTLSWNASQNTTSSTIVLNGGQITITPGAGNYNGSQQFSPVGTWVMTVSNAYGKNTCQTIVTNSANATVPPPVVTSVSPLQAAVGASAIVYGNNFVNVSSIDFYDVHNQFAGRIYPTNNALNVDGDGMQIQFTVPSSITPGNYSIKVVTSWGTSNGSPFSVQSPAT